jgi:hypothetical protein
MDIDHIFIFTDLEHKVVDELISFGLHPNESRINLGQGTTNRTFTFENFFLEIVWVHNQNEIESELVKPTGLWERAAFSNNNFAPFGLIVLNNESSDHLFENAYKYQPSYFEEGRAFEILQNSVHPGLPWTCRMPFRREKPIKTTPINHPNKIKTLTRAGFQYCGGGNERFPGHFNNEKTIEFIPSARNWLTLTFDENKQGLRKEFAQLQLTIEY